MDDASFHRLLISKHIDVDKFRKDVHTIRKMGYVESNMLISELFRMVHDVFHKLTGCFDMGKQHHMKGKRTDAFGHEQFKLITGEDVIAMGIERR